MYSNIASAYVGIFGRRHAWLTNIDCTEYYKLLETLDALGLLTR